MTAILKSLDGRFFGRDKDGYMTPQNGIAHPVTTPTTAVAITPAGVSVMSATAAKSYTLSAPVPGARKVLASTVSATLARTITLASGATFVSTALSTGTGIVLNGLGQVVRLVGLSTSQYMIEGNTGATLS